MIPSVAIGGTPSAAVPSATGPRSALSQEAARPTLGRCLSTALRARAAQQGDSAAAPRWSAVVGLVGTAAAGFVRTRVTPEDGRINWERWVWMGMGQAVNQAIL